MRCKDGPVLGGEIHWLPWEEGGAQGRLSACWLRKRVMKSGSLRHKARKRDGGARCEGRWCSLGGSESEVLLEHLRRGLQHSSVKGESWNLGFEGR